MVTTAGAARSTASAYEKAGRTAGAGADATAAVLDSTPADAIARGPPLEMSRLASRTAATPSAPPTVHLRTSNVKCHGATAIGPKLANASDSRSKHSNTINSLVTTSRSASRLVTLRSFSTPPCVRTAENA